MSKRQASTHYETISEKAFTAQIIALARWYKWRTAHFRPAMTKRGRWVTPVQGDGAGFPDLVLCHKGKGRLIFAELKTEKGKLSAKQNEWIDDLRWCEEKYSCVVACVWRPSDIEEIEELLK